MVPWPVAKKVVRVLKTKKVLECKTLRWGGSVGGNRAGGLAVPRHLRPSLVFRKETPDGIHVPCAMVRPSEQCPPQCVPVVASLTTT
jgi:hypothetical protein